MKNTLLILTVFILAINSAWCATYKQTDRYGRYQGKYVEVSSTKMKKYDRNHRFSYDNYYGANAGALIKLAEEKGYELIAFTTGLNLVFIDKKYNKFQIIDPSDIKLHIGWPPSNKEMITY